LGGQFDLDDKFESAAASKYTPQEIEEKSRQKAIRGLFRVIGLILVNFDFFYTQISRRIVYDVSVQECDISFPKQSISDLLHKWRIANYALIVKSWQNISLSLLD
jgi:hypothetical protein